ncbi:MAG: hypothetical protein ABL929_12425 [Ferruginibacter sp.]|nr:hypothetical protein [Ferruginibacter sp.]
MTSLIFNKKIINTITIIVLVVFVSISSSCYNDAEELLYPQAACDTSNVTYNRIVLPILSSNCLSCHGGNTPSSSIRLDDYLSLKTYVDNGRLWGSVSHAASYSPMPKNATKLSTCNLRKIKIWIDSGAPNN